MKPSDEGTPVMALVPLAFLMDLIDYRFLILLILKQIRHHSIMILVVHELQFPTFKSCQHIPGHSVNQPTARELLEMSLKMMECLILCDFFFLQKRFYSYHHFFLFSIWIKLSFPNNYTWKELLGFERLIVLSADKP